MTKSKKYQTLQKSLKARDNPKLKKKILTSSTFGETQHKELLNARIKDMEYVI